MTDHQDHDHEDHDADDHAHNDHAPENPSWVLAPVLVGLVLGLIVLVALGLGADVAEFVS